MSNVAVVPGAIPGMRVLQREVAHFAWSPDGAWLATADVVDREGQCAVRVYDPDDGREALTIRAREVLGLAWASSEHLLVVRAQDLGARAVLHAVPDGAALETLALPNVPRVAVRLPMSASRHPDACRARALVLPSRWPGGLRQDVRQRAGYVVAMPELAIVSRFDPDAWTALPRLAHVRAATATLSPDGDALAVWLGAATTDTPGSLWLQPATGGAPKQVCVAGRDVVDLSFAGPDLVLLRSRDGGAGDALDVVDTVLRAVVFSSRWPNAGEPAGDVAYDHLAIDVHPDRHSAMLVGHRRDAGPRDVTLREIDLGSQSMTGTRPCIATANVDAGFGAAYTGDDDAVAVALGKGPRALRLLLGATLPDALATPTTEWNFPLEGKKPRNARIARAPGAVGLCIAWDVDAPLVRRNLPLPPAQRLAWIVRDAVATAVRG